MIWSVGKNINYTGRLTTHLPSKYSFIFLDRYYDGRIPYLLGQQRVISRSLSLATLAEVVTGGGLCGVRVKTNCLRFRNYGPDPKVPWLGKHSTVMFLRSSGLN